MNQSNSHNFKNHMLEKYSNIIDVEKALTIFDKEVDSIKVGTKEEPEIKVPIKCDMNKNIFLKCLSEYLKKEGLIYDKDEEPTSNNICREWFEYGEYGSFEIIINEHMNIVGGRVIKSGKK